MSKPGWQCLPLLSKIDFPAPSLYNLDITKVVNNIYATQKNQIRGLSKKEFEALRVLCRLSKNLYNVGIYSIRQYYFQEKKHLSYESNYHHCKDNENYKSLNTDIAQQTLKVVDRSFRSFFGLIKACKRGEYHYHEVKLPKYLPKEGYFSLILPRIKVKDGFFAIPMSSTFKKKYGKIKLPFPQRLGNKKIKEVRIHPKYNARFFEVEFVYEMEQVQTILDPTHAIAIDLGINNLATCVTSNGASFICDGKRLKSINHWYNKVKASLQSITDKQGFKRTTNRLARLTIKRNNQVRDYMNKTARTIVNYCIENKIGKMVIGYNPYWKHEINMGRRINQQFVQIPHSSLRLKLHALCDRYNIEFIKQEEAYTSKSSFIDQDPLPEYKPNKKHSFCGKRIKRGLYKASTGQTINADVNGAANILRKSNHEINFAQMASGLLASPLRVRII